MFFSVWAEAKLSEMSESIVRQESVRGEARTSGQTPGHRMFATSLRTQHAL